MCGWIYINYSKQQKSIQTFRTAQQQQLKINNNINKWKIKVEEFKNTCQKENELLVLSGTRTVNVTISNGDIDIGNGKDTKNPLYFMEKYFKGLQTKSLTIYATYDYSYIYDLNNLYIDDKELDNNKLIINLNRANVKLKPIAEEKDKTVLKDETHILSGKFTPQEIQAIQKRVWADTYNGLINDNSLYDKALQNTKEDLLKLTNKIGIKNVDIEIVDTGTEENNDAEVIKDSNIDN